MHLCVFTCSKYTVIQTSYCSPESNREWYGRSARSEQVSAAKMEMIENSTELLRRKKTYKLSREIKGLSAFLE